MEAVRRVLENLWWRSAEGLSRLRQSPVSGDHQTFLSQSTCRPRNGGKYCVGARERYRSCNAIECPWDTPGFRELQCSEFDNRDVGIHGVPKETKWVPKYAGSRSIEVDLPEREYSVSENERCKLYCRVSDSAAFYLLKETVVDGTPCDRNSDDICIDNTCHKVGWTCDGLFVKKHWEFRRAATTSWNLPLNATFVESAEVTEARAALCRASSTSVAHLATTKC